MWSLLCLMIVGLAPSCSDDDENPCDNDSACIKVVIPASGSEPERTFWRSAPGRVCPCEE